MMQKGICDNTPPLLGNKMQFCIQLHIAYSEKKRLFSVRM